MPGDQIAGCCLDEGIGQNPVDFLNSRIAELQEHIWCRSDTTEDEDRVFHETVYKYFPRNGLKLVCQVFYSEPIDRAVADEAYFATYFGPDTSSFQYDYIRLSQTFELPLETDRFSDTEDFRESGTLIDSSNVVYYLYRPTLPTYYHGNVLLRFGAEEPDSTGMTGPVDLAGNALDGNPEEITFHARGRGHQAVRTYPGEQDSNYEWDPPDWHENTNSGLISGEVGYWDVIAQYDMNEFGFSDGMFIGDCDYYNGFWYVSWVDGYPGFDVNIVMPDSSYFSYHFTTPFPYSEGFWLDHDPDAGFLADSGRYCWLTGSFMTGGDMEISGSIAYRVDVVEGSVFQQEVCRGYVIVIGSTAYRSGASIDSLYESGEALYSYGYYPDTTLSSFVGGYVVLPGGEDSEGPIAERAASAPARQTEPVEFSIRQNPVDSRLYIGLDGTESSIECELYLYDITGRMVLERRENLDEGRFGIEMDTGALPSGVYVLMIRLNETESVRMISIIH